MYLRALDQFEAIALKGSDSATVCFFAPDGRSIGIVTNTGVIRPLLNTSAYEGGARLSPDGRWLVYISNESGQNEVYLRPFPALDRRWTISTQGGTQALWNPNGKEIFYRNGDKMMAVEVTTTPEVKLSAPRVLFEKRYAFGAGITMANYDVTRDGQRFIMVKDESAPPA